MKFTLKSRVAGLISIAPLTAMDRPSISSCAPSGMSLPRRLSSGGRSRASAACLAPLRSMAIRLVWGFRSQEVFFLCVAPLFGRRSGLLCALVTGRDADEIIRGELAKQARIIAPHACIRRIHEILTMMQQCASARSSGAAGPNFATAFEPCLITGHRHLG